MKAIIQVWIVIVLGGTIGLTALAWNNPEKGSPIDILKTRITSDEVKK